MRLLRALALLVVCSFSAHAAGTVAISSAPIGNGLSWLITARWTGDASNGSVPATTIRLNSLPQGQISGYFLQAIETQPGVPSPTNGYTVTITDPSGVDALGGNASFVSSSISQLFSPASSAPPLDTITLNITGQSIAGGRGTIYIFLTNPNVTRITSAGGGGGGGTVTSVNFNPNIGNVTGVPITGAGTINYTLSAANLISLFSGCSGALYLGADGACHSPAGGGTVTSVGQTVPSWLSVAGSPVTTVGTLAITPAAGQTSHQVIGTCNALTSFQPCNLVAGDLPSTTVNAVTNDTNVTGSISGQTLTLGWIGTLAKARLLNTVVYTDQSNAFSTGTQDASAAQHTIPNKTGLNAAKPATCTTGETYFATDVTAGLNQFDCTNTNVWTQQLSTMVFGGQTVTLGGTAGVQGNGAKIQLSTGSAISGHCVQFDVNGNTVDAGAACGTGGSPGGSTNDIQVNNGGAFAGGRGTLDSSGNEVIAGSITTGNGGSVAGQIAMSNGTATTIPANSWGWQAPATLTTSWFGRAPNANPTANSTMRFPAPTSNVSQWAWAIPLWIDTTNTASSGFTLDASGATGVNAFRIPNVAGATATSNGALVYDTTNNMYHGGQSAADAKIPTFTVTPTNGDCATWVVSGSNYKLGDSACGTGGSTIIGEGWYPAVAPASPGSIYAAHWSTSAGCCSPTPAVGGGGDIDAIRVSTGGSGWAELGIWLPSGWGGNFTIKIWHTIAADNSGNGSMTLNVQTSCYNPGTTDMSVATTYNTASTISETFSGTNYKTGFYGSNESVSPSTSGCAANELMVVRITRANSGTSTDASFLMGAYVTLH